MTQRAVDYTTVQRKIGVLGAGSWGTTLANLLAKKGYPVTLWAYEADLVERIQTQRINDLYLPGIPLAETLTATNDPGEAVRDKDLVLLVPPSQLMRRVVGAVAEQIGAQTVIVSASKGIENETLMTMSELLEEVLPPSLRRHTAFLSGPSFARETATELPTAVVAAAKDESLARQVQTIFATDYFRVYTNSDVIGVELAGALKNVMALAAGVADGLGFGYNSRAALITRGLTEMTRIGLAKGAQAETFAGLAGMGDLVLTCTGDLSRNRSVGIELGRGRVLDEILGEMNMVAEGVKTTLAAWQLAQKLNVEAPIIEQMFRILYENIDPRQAVSELMGRAPKAEKLSR
ncbi:MAG: NAD(P)-dependent glycerol-3-phosphate dehydrogenase [Desulfuromonadaceae bacterium]|nr:NAD(P)-dependent glycerol-3-phosphate dehydrogenase [Desulfuromonadaceae bacterium]